MDITYVRLVSLVAVAAIYTLFDVFNRRNIPNMVVYGTFGYGLFLTMLYLNVVSLVSIGIAGVILALGYQVYRAGQIGAADIFEFAVLSMIMPLQMNYMIPATNIQTPFILSLFINTGIVAILVVPIYYIPLRYRAVHHILDNVEKRDAVRSVMLAIIYMFLIAFLVMVAGISTGGFALMAALMVASIAITLFQRPITMSMIRYVTVSRMESGDIIALNLMPQSTISNLQHRVKHFDKLVTDQLRAEMSRKHVTMRLPVYKNAMPFAIAILGGTIVTILFGNLLFAALLRVPYTLALLP
ncbi:MAG: hypothetical protein M1474_01170 [Candidatus Marsarchaeota archaeon]|nr:hypothetical protein [Candidatus Marsarchaeota archaeon]